ncbi:MAG: DNA translocase FtsK 4TM domain-containing protein [Candidatus Dojkabacteria bacterium]|jgi:S-DNA-T family DNA segregation ATPase FtsK/SpoIIIE|nr:DNA translocase FtsK [Candidatus Dojkabacteria bacterium]MDD2270249.1 DNA translocase FtsK 4TM domain-containing protein [Candidatus Dojkabacteria bacterium]
MPRRKKKNKAVNIKSSETKIVSGMILLVIGLMLIITPFVQESTVVFDQIRHFLGFSSLVFGLPTLYFSLNLITRGKKFTSWKQGVGLIVAAFAIATLLAIWMNPDKVNDFTELANSGGILGRELHFFLVGLVGQLIEIVIILLVLIVAFSLITNTKLEQISDLVAEPQIEPKFSFKNLFSFNGKDGGIDDEKRVEELVIKTGEEEMGDEVKIEQEIEIEEPKQEQYIESPAYNASQNQSINKEESDDADLQPKSPKYTNWQFPTIDLLKEPERQSQNKDRYKKDALVIEATLKSFGIEGKVVQIAIGPTVVRYSLSISVGIKVSRIKNLGNDLALALASQNSSVRIEAPIPGTSYIGVEIPNPTPNYVYAKDMVKKLKSEESLYELPLLLGKDITGRSVIKDLAKIPHLLIAGATGTGKSVGVNSIITGLLYTKSPDEVKFIMVDPKMVELSLYNGLPHLLNPVITDMQLVSSALQWCIEEMNKRYRILKQAKVKKITEYNQKMGYSAMPYIIVVVDEMADLMLTVGTDVESKIQRLAQMGRAVGLHLLLATQRPSVQVITGLIKANVPGRIAYAVATAMESRIILDQTGGETLLGNGDMLYKDNTTPKSIRLQGTFTDTKDTENILNFIKEQVADEDIEYSEELKTAMEEGPSSKSDDENSERDDEFEEALNIFISAQKASASYLQRRLKIGYNKAARIMDQLYKEGAIGPQQGSKPRDVLVSSAEQILGKDTDDSEY